MVSEYVVNLLRQVNTPITPFSSCDTINQMLHIDVDPISIVVHRFVSICRKENSKLKESNNLLHEIIS